MSEPEIENEVVRETHLRDYLRILLKRKNTVILAFLVVFFFVLMKTITSVPLYSAATSVLIEKSEPNPIMSNYSYTPFDPDFLATQSHIIKSTSVAQKVVRLLDLENSYDSFSKQHGKPHAIFESVTGWGSS